MTHHPEYLRGVADAREAVGTLEEIFSNQCQHEMVGALRLARADIMALADPKSSGLWMVGAEVFHSRREAKIYAAIAGKPIRAFVEQS